MKLNRVDTPLPPSVLLWESESKIWTLQLDTVMYGVRIRVTNPKKLELVADYCAGTSPTWQLIVLSVVAKIMDTIPENIDIRELRGFFPKWVVRPMVNDPRCWEELCKLAEVPCVFDYDDRDKDDSEHAERHYHEKLAEIKLVWNGE